MIFEYGEKVTKFQYIDYKINNIDYKNLYFCSNQLSNVMNVIMEISLLIFFFLSLSLSSILFIQCFASTIKNIYIS